MSEQLILSRRQTLAALAASAAMPVLSSCGRALGAAPTVPIALGPLPVTAATQEVAATALLDSVAEKLLRFSPGSATTLGIDTGARAPLRSQLSDSSIAGQRRVADLLSTDLARVSAIDATTLSFATRTSIEVVKSAYSTALEGFALPYGDVAVGGWRNTPYVVNQLGGAYIDTPQFLATDHPLISWDDVDAYISRLKALPAQIDGELERMKSAQSKGLTPPNFIVDRTIKALTIALASARSGGEMVDRLDRALRNKTMHDISVEQARRIVTADVAAALERQLAEFQAERATATDIAGMWSRPSGDEYYRWALKASTTTTMTPDEVHAMGLEQVKDYQSRMDPILRSIGYTTGSVGSRMQALAKDPRYKFAQGDPGRAEIVAYIQERLAKIRAVLPRAFATMVRGNVEVKRMSPEQEPGAPAAYGGAGSIDGKIPGKFWINLRDTNLHSKYSLPDLAAHEAIPGHVWQGEYANKLPLIRTLLAFNAYSEGWALYAEQLVDELGMYDDFPVGRLGYLQSIAFRACRLVVDTGIHAKRWTRDQGVRYFVEVNGSNPIEVANEVDRYCSWPGQACGYKVGHSTINRLRDRAKTALGPKFDLRTFDDALVLGGNVPMDVLALNVDDYISRTRAP